MMNFGGAMSMAVVPNPLAKLLSDFLLGCSKAKQEGPDQHALIQIPVIQRLTAEYLARQPAHRALPTQDIAMCALGHYWAQVFKPERLTLAFRDEWRQYLLLAVAYFVPFRRRLRCAGYPFHPSAFRPTIASENRTIFGRKPYEACSHK
jgi:hypothetical protein